MKNFLISAGLMVLLLSSCENQPELEEKYFNYDFYDNLEGWNIEFANYKQGERAMLQLSYGLDQYVNSAQEPTHTLRLSGIKGDNNLHIFALRQISGLLPSQEYQMKVKLKVAAATRPEKTRGTAKILAGTYVNEPFVFLDNDRQYKMDFRGNQQPEELGTLHPEIEDFEFLSNQNSITTKTDSYGNLFVIIGSEITSKTSTYIYFDNIQLTFTAVQ